MGDEKEAEVVVAEKPEEAPPPEQPTTEAKFTQADLDAALTKQYDKLNTKLSTQGQELKKLREQVTAPPTPVQPSKTTELMLEALKAQAVDGEPNPRIAQLEQALAQEKVQATHDAKYQEQQREALTERAKLETRIEEAGFDPAARDFDDVWDDWDDRNKIDANWARTNRKLTRVLEVLAPKAEAETADKSKDEEAARAKAEEEGKLTTETGSPSAAARSFRQLEDQWREDPSNQKVTDRYLAARRERGI